MALAYRKGQRDAAGTRRHLSNNNNKLLRKEGRGTKTHVSFPSSLLPPLPHPLITVSENAVLFAFR